MRQISFRISDREYEHLTRFCKLTERNQSDVLRQLIRKLAVSGALNPIDNLGESIYPDADL
ncbi:MAG: ribbon-helix-helix protein, CopG family [Limnoraphis robusta]|jgi:hypothetical protein